MSLYATPHSIPEVDEAFPRASDVRDLLWECGFIPLVRIMDIEHWTRGPHRIEFLWQGDVPSEASTGTIRYATLIKVGDGWTIQMD